jgi:putative Holliday junction resolvase
MRYLGVDYGSRYIGLAMGDDESYLAMAFDTVLEKDLKRQLAVIEQIVLDEDIDQVIVGYPLSLDGGESDQTTETITFITELSGKLGIPVEKEDERLTSQFAQKLIEDAEGSSNQDEHAHAAASVLQTYLDRMRNEGS